MTTPRIRVMVYDALASYSRVVELEAWQGCSAATPTPTPTPTATPTPTPTATPTPSPTPGVSTNVARASNGGTATASSSLAGGAPDIAIDGSRVWAIGAAWKDATPDVYPDWLQVDFNGEKTINEIDVYFVRDDFLNTAEPTLQTTFSIYGVTAFDVQYWNGASWVTIPAGSVTANDKVWRRFTFPAITTNRVRVVVNNAQASYSRIVELEAWTATSSASSERSATVDLGLLAELARSVYRLAL